MGKEKKADDEIATESDIQRQPSSNRASKRPIQRSKEPLDIEPVEEKKFVIENPQTESFEIDDPW